MSASKMQAAIIDVLSGTTLIMVGFAGLLVRLGFLDFSHVPQWTAIEQWWPLLLIIVGLATWLVDMDHVGAAANRSTAEIKYGK